MVVRKGKNCCYCFGLGQVQAGCMVGQSQAQMIFVSFSGNKIWMSVSCGSMDSNVFSQPFHAVG